MSALIINNLYIQLCRKLTYGVRPERILLLLLVPQYATSYIKISTRFEKDCSSQNKPNFNAEFKCTELVYYWHFNKSPMDSICASFYISKCQNENFRLTKSGDLITNARHIEADFGQLEESCGVVRRTYVIAIVAAPCSLCVP